MGDIQGAFSATAGFFPAGTLILASSTGTATIAQWQAALRAVKFTSTAVTPNAANRTVSFTVNDGVQNSNTVTKTVTVTAVNQTPVVTTSSGSTTFFVGGSVIAVDSGLTVSDGNNATLASGTVSITSGFQTAEDVLAFTNNNATTYGNIAASYNGGVLTLTSAGATTTVAQWQAALRAVTYNDTATSPNTTTRTIGFVVNDGTVSSAAATKTVTIGLASTTVAASAASATFGATAQTVMLTANVTSSGGTVNAGTVTFTLKNSSDATIGTAVTSGTVTNGSATASYTLPANTAIGSYTIQAVYNAAGSFGPSSGSTGSLTIGTAPTTTAVSGPFTYKTRVSTCASSGLINVACLAFDAAGNLYVSGYPGDTISKVTPGGTVSTFVSSGSGLSGPYGLAFDEGWHNPGIRAWRGVCRRRERRAAARTSLLELF